MGCIVTWTKRLATEKLKKHMYCIMMFVDSSVLDPVVDYTLCALHSSNQVNAT